MTKWLEAILDTMVSFLAMYFLYNPKINKKEEHYTFYQGNGYMPCNGYVPCQPEHLSPDLLAERIDGAMPCHNYKGLENLFDSVI